MIKLYHCRGARSLRVVWTLEEMGLPYEPVLLPFPPRRWAREYLEVNPLGTIPFMTDGDVRMSESTGICFYLTARYGPTHLAIAPDEPEYASFLNWLFFSDATLTFPQSIVIRYRKLESPDRRSNRAADDYEKWFFGRLRAVEAALEGREWICGGRFTIADVAIAYALYLAREIADLGEGLGPNARRFLNHAVERDAFQRALELDKRAPAWRY